MNLNNGVKKRKKLKLKKSVIFKSISILTIFVSFLIFIMFVRLDVLPFKYLFLLLLFLGVIDAFLYFVMSRKNYKARLIGTTLSVILIFCFSVALNFQNATLNFFKKISILNIQTEVFNVVVHKNSSLNNLKDLEHQKVSFVNNRKGISKALKKIEKEAKFESVPFKDASSLINLFEDEQVDVFLMEEEELKIYTEIKNDFKNNMKVITKITVDVPNEKISKDVKITKEPFSVFITGIDTYGGLSKVSRSDVNMVITVNPITHQILLTSIPRDYYVQIDGTTGLKDKLTHAGLMGVETSIKTIESLLETNINYYVKINFTSLVKIIDAIDGVDVINPFEFTADYQEENEAIYYVFKKGNIHLNGHQALAYVRERYGLREGDTARARHQQQVIEGMVKKVTSPSILTKYTKILGSIEGNFATDIPVSSITGFIQKQLDENSSWSVEKYVLSGVDSMELTASFKDLYSAVMLPNEESIKEAIEKINSIKNES